MVKILEGDNESDDPALPTAQYKANDTHVMDVTLQLPINSRHYFSLEYCI